MSELNYKVIKGHCNGRDTVLLGDWVMINYHLFNRRDSYQVQCVTQIANVSHKNLVEALQEDGAEQASKATEAIEVFRQDFATKAILRPDAYEHIVLANDPKLAYAWAVREDNLFDEDIHRFLLTNADLDTLIDYANKYFTDVDEITNIVMNKYPAHSIAWYADRVCSANKDKIIDKLIELGEPLGSSSYYTLHSASEDKQQAIKQAVLSQNDIDSILTYLYLADDCHVDEFIPLIKQAALTELDISTQESSRVFDPSRASSIIHIINKKSCKENPQLTEALTDLYLNNIKDRPSQAFDWLNKVNPDERSAKQVIQDSKDPLWARQYCQHIKVDKDMQDIIINSGNTEEAFFYCKKVRHNKKIAQIIIDDSNAELAAHYCSQVKDYPEMRAVFES